MTEQRPATFSNSPGHVPEGQRHTGVADVDANLRLAPGLLVLERQPRLELLLKRELASPRILVRPCRSPQDLCSLAQRMPASLCVIDWSGWPTETLGLLERLHLDRCGARPIVVGPAELASLEWAAREAGAVGFFAPLSEPPQLIALCRRVLDWIPFPNTASP